ncbi:MAG TPA: cytochrome d ubiquinol oxidase subunit II [Gemmatimonadaceae bacterium]|nr:cytochrome d ubiquinol oxidase subunit II [Gemmatimonadaceae bacterium]
MSTLATLGMPEIVAGIMMIALTVYALLGGADFGGGVWDLLVRGPRREEARALVANAIGPIWEANHVWLIVVIVILFTAFPPTYALLGTLLHVPLSLMLLGIVLRGSAFVFRSYGARDDAAQRRWGRIFAVASTITPVLLGVNVGAIVSGAVGEAATRLPRAGSGVGAPAASFADLFLRPWLAPFPFAVGALTLALFAFLAAVYLTVAARDAVLREDFRRRALGAALAVFVTAFGALLLARAQAPHVSAGLLGTGWALPFQLATGGAAVIAIWGLWTRRWRTARVAAAAQTSLILWGWALVQFPFLVPTVHEIRGVAAPRVTLRLLLWGLAGGSLVLLPSLAYLFRTFAAARDVPSEVTSH